jgi:hypothetical protein
MFQLIARSPALQLPAPPTARKSPLLFFAHAWTVPAAGARTVA